MQEAPKGLIDDVFQGLVTAPRRCVSMTSDSTNDTLGFEARKYQDRSSDWIADNSSSTCKKRLKGREYFYFPD